MLDKTENFLLGTNVNEPVAVEIPVQVNDIDALRQFLENVGFGITQNGAEKDKILIDTTLNRAPSESYSIITPALKPEDVKKLYEALKYAIEQYNEFVGAPNRVRIVAPHIIDLKHLVVAKDNISAKKESAAEVSKIIRELESSKEAHFLDANSRNFAQDIADIFPSGYIFNGATVPDPYSVVTGWNTRFVRYGTKDPDYAIGYSSILGKKYYMGYQNITPDEKRTLGFVFQYKNNPSEQLYFSNSGVEFGYKPISIARLNSETVVNRFDNPCVGIYLVWAPLNQEHKFYAYKIDENDPRYQIIKEYYSPSNPNLHDRKSERFQAWKKEGKTNQTYMPTKDGHLEQIKSNVDSEIQKQRDNKQRIANQQQRIKDIENLISNIHSDLSREQFSKIVIPEDTDNLSRFGDIQNEIDRCRQNIIEYDNKFKEFSKTIDDIKSEISSNDYLQEHEFTELQKLGSLLNKKQWELETKQQNLTNYLKTYSKNKERATTNCVKGRYTITPHVSRELSPDIRKQILLKYKELDRGSVFAAELEVAGESQKEQSAQNLINLYLFAKEDEKPEIFEILCDVNKRIPKFFKKTLKQCVYGMDDKILTELFHGDNMFVNHTKRATKLMQLKIAKLNVEQKLRQTQGSQNTNVYVNKDVSYERRVA